MQKGKLSVNAENIFPIIKKWLYSEHDIFIREIISNSNDAIRKYEKLVNIAEAEKDEKGYRITVRLSKKQKTISIEDNGIGMTEDEVARYINQIAFSGAIDFLEKYKDKSDDKQIIGHFGLGFYSAFMVSEKVEIETRSFAAGEKAVHWESDGETDFEIRDSERTERGTIVTLHIDKENKDFLEEHKCRELVMKYFAFLPIEIYFINLDSDKKDDAVQKPINNTKPLWLKKPSDCTDEEYKEFYRNTFFDFSEPLFWVHINMDYPFNLKGILYFPKLKHEFETMEGQVKLYYNQVFVADNIKEIIPEFLLLLKGTIDCPDLPLNVSRSFLQSDAYVSKISNHINKKVSATLKKMFESERDNYNKYWEDINPFIKYGCIRDEKFYDKVKDILIFKNIDDTYSTLDQIKGSETADKVIYYVSDVNSQSQYIRNFKNIGKSAVILNTMIDNHFISFLETKMKGLKFKRIDSDISEDLKDSGEIDTESEKKLESFYRKLRNDETLKVKLQSLKMKDIPAIITLSEESRRMADMQKMYGNMFGGNAFPGENTLILNSGNDIVKRIIETADDEGKKEKRDLIANYIYDLALLSHKPLKPEEMSDFIGRSTKLLQNML
jgi:molecular chaperone HtpG